jgi:hypothetical protein
MTSACEQTSSREISTAPLLAAQKIGIPNDPRPWLAANWMAESKTEVISQSAPFG